MSISDIKTLEMANKNDISFFNSLDYKMFAKKTKAAVCITTNNLQQYLPNNLLSLEYSSEESSDSGFSKSCKLGIPPKRFKKL